MKFNVFIERVRDATPAGHQRAAQGLAQRYGFPPDVVLARLNGGRFAAWNDLDYDTAKRCASEVEALGCVCAVVENRSGPSAPPPVAPSRPTAMGVAPAPAAGARAGRVSQPPPAATPAYATGLSAAYSGGAREQDLGALGGGDAGWSVGTLDGSEDEAPTVAASPPNPKAPPPIPGSPPPAQWQGAVDPFAPPEAQKDMDLDLGGDAPAPARPSGPTAGPAHASPGGATPPGTIRITEAPPMPKRPLERALDLLAESRVNFAVGVLLATLLGFLPAHVVGCAREGGYDEIRAEATAGYGAIDSPEAWDSAADAREEGLSRLASRRTNVAVSGMLVWIAAFAALGYVWFRVIDWDRQGPRVAPAGKRPPARPRPPARAGGGTAAR
jgi:hypothetical protein